MDTTHHFLQTKEEISNWLIQHRISNFDLDEDLKYGFVVNVRGDVSLSGKNLTHIPVKFNTVKGHFDCSQNSLTSLEFAPHIVQNFNCSYNELSNLEGGPLQCRSYFCSRNRLTSLKGGPHYIEISFYCYENKLTSLEFCPTRIGGLFDCHRNNIQDLEFFPRYAEEMSLKFNIALGQAQNIEDFRKLFSIHLQTLGIKREKQLLENSIEGVNLALEKKHKI